MSDACVFCAIAEGRVPADVVWQSDRVLAFRDLHPQAPTHVLVVPRSHARDLADLATTDTTLLGEVFAAAAAVAEQEGLSGGYRVITNTGPDSGQTVFHLHVHVLGGRNLGALAG
jgi:histidine triad (HIT) family protein